PFSPPLRARRGGTGVRFRHSTHRFRQRPACAGKGDNTMYDVEAVRKDFPILQRQVHGKPLTYLDNAATTQKPRQVIDALVAYYEGYNANIHRGLHKLAEEATAAYEDSRAKVGRFIKSPAGAKSIVFTRNTT